MKRILPVIGLLAFALPAWAASPGVSPQQFAWSWEGIFGTYDREQVQRGLEVFTTQCHSCHSLKYVRFRDLVAIGLSEDEAEVLAAAYEVPGDLDEWGDETTKPAELQHTFPAPYRNDTEARALNNGALPPDLSLMVKARVDGANYIASLLMDPDYNQSEPDANGLYHNPYFAGGSIAMAPPLYEGLLVDAEGNDMKVEDLARDITAFLAWTAEPTLEDRKRMGMKVVLFLLVLTGLYYVWKRKIWANVEH